MLKDKIIKKSKNLWISLVILISKKNKNIRFCVNYKKVNELIIENAHPLPIINNTVDKIEGKKYYISINLASEY